MCIYLPTPVPHWLRVVLQGVHISPSAGTSGLLCLCGEKPSVFGESPKTGKRQSCIPGQTRQGMRCGTPEVCATESEE